MYQQQVYQEERLIAQGWMAIARDVARFFSRVGAMFALPRSRTLTTFTVHRVPGTDALR